MTAEIVTNAVCCGLESATHLKTYQELKINDEFDAYFGRSFRRCRVIKKLADGDFIYLSLTPTTRMVGKANDKATLKFLGSAEVAVYLEPAPSPKTAFDRYSTAILSVVGPAKLYTSTEISERLAQTLGLALPKSRVSGICKELVKRGQLIGRKLGNLAAYRLKLPQETDLPVVEFAGKGSQKLGWIKEWRFFNATQSLQPVVHWLDGSECFSNENWLDPAMGWQKQRIEMAQRRSRGELIPEFSAIPGVFLLELRDVWCDKKTREALLLHLAKLLGFLPEFAQGFTGAYAEARNSTLTHIEVYHPDWRTGAVEP